MLTVLSSKYASLLLGFTVEAVLVEKVLPCVLDVWRDIITAHRQDLTGDVFTRVISSVIRNGAGTNSDIVVVYRDNANVVHSRILLQVRPRTAWGLTPVCPVRCHPEARTSSSSRSAAKAKAANAMRTVTCMNCARKWVVAKPEWIHTVSGTPYWCWADYPLCRSDWPTISEVQREIQRM